MAGNRKQFDPYKKTIRTDEDRSAFDVSFNREPEPESKESKSVDPNLNVEKMDLDELRAFVEKNKEINQEAFGDDIDALIAHVSAVERAQVRLKENEQQLEDERQMAEAILASMAQAQPTAEETARKIAAMEDEQKKQEAQAITDSEQAEQERIQRVQQSVEHVEEKDIEEYFTLQVNTFRTLCEKALLQAKECYPAPFFGKNEALLAQQARIRTICEGATRSILGLLERRKLLDTAPFHLFIAEQKDALIRKTLPKELRDLFSPKLAYARQLIETLVNIYPAGGRRENARKEINEELDQLTAGIKDKEAVKNLDDYNNILTMKIMVVEEQEAKKQQVARAESEAAHHVDDLDGSLKGPAVFHFLGKKEQPSSHVPSRKEPIDRNKGKWWLGEEAEMASKRPGKPGEKGKVEQQGTELGGVGNDKPLDRTSTMRRSRSGS